TVPTRPEASFRGRVRRPDPCFQRFRKRDARSTHGVLVGADEIGGWNELGRYRRGLFPGCIGVAGCAMTLLLSWAWYLFGYSSPRSRIPLLRPCSCSTRPRGPGDGLEHSPGNAGRTLVAW